MSDEFGEFLIESAKTALINSSLSSDRQLMPLMIYNNTDEGHCVLETISHELKHCDSFSIAVAFITMGGLASLVDELNAINKDKIKGRILTTDYLTFNDPAALRWLKRYDNIELKVLEKPLHTKGYIFRKGDHDTIIIGSSNFTDSALKSNMEWNIKITSTEQGDLSAAVKKEFERMWEASVPLDEKWLHGYEQFFKEKALERRKRVEPSKEITPTPHQKEALEEIKKLRTRPDIARGGNRALLISATGTGKTYISAFDVKDANPKKMLFMVHRGTILRDAKASYERVIGDKHTYGIYQGSKKEGKSDYIFASVDTLVNHLKDFNPEEFDYIVCDEAHRVVTDTQKTIIDYFKPKFMLGMTATPERTGENPTNVYEVFNYEVPYEIRLSKALEEQLVCPFHYYGISSLNVKGKDFDIKKFPKLETKERVDKIVREIKSHPFSGNRIKGLIFCSGQDEAKQLEKELSNHYNVTALISDNPISDDDKKKLFNELQKDDGNLDFIISVGILNEGVDLPRVNEIIMLRPTQSALLFLQQLGRGLRKRDDKEFLTVLDFIGNYKNKYNYNIPIALFGDSTRNREKLKGKIQAGNKIIPGPSTISFDSVARKQIIDSINSTSIYNLRELKQLYENASDRLGHDPSLTELYEIKGLDPRVIVNNYKSLNDFRKLIKSKEQRLFDKDTSDVIREISSFVISGQRPHECIILNEIIEHKCLSFDTFSNKLSEYDEEITPEMFRDVVSLLSKEMKYFGKTLCLLDKETVTISEEFEKVIKDQLTRDEILDATRCGMNIYCSEYKPKESKEYGLRLYKNYTYVNFCRLKNISKSYSSTIMGYKILGDCCPIFVTLHKKKESNQYQDHFVNKYKFHWQSKPVKNDESKTIKSIRESNSNNLKLILFVRIFDNKDKDFYFCGRARLIEGSYKKDETTNAKGEKIEVRAMDFILDNPVPDDLYDRLDVWDYLEEKEETLSWP